MTLEIFDGQDVVRVERFAEFKRIQHRQGVEFRFRGTDEARSPLLARFTLDRKDVLKLVLAFVSEENTDVDGLYVLRQGGVGIDPR